MKKPKPKKPEKPRVDEFHYVYRRDDSGDINRNGSGEPLLYPERYAIRDIDGKRNPDFERVRIVSAPVRGRRK
jgi:hypothetical protein